MTGLKLQSLLSPIALGEDDHDGCLFIASVHRKPLEELELSISTPVVLPKSDTKSEKVSEKASEKVSEKIIALMKEDATITIELLAEHCKVTSRSIERNLKKLQERNEIRRVGPAKGGYWKVLA